MPPNQILIHNAGDLHDIPLASIKFKQLQLHFSKIIINVSIPTPSFVGNNKSGAQSPLTSANKTDVIGASFEASVNSRLFSKENLIFSKNQQQKITFQNRLISVAMI